MEILTFFTYSLQDILLYCIILVYFIACPYVMSYFAHFVIKKRGGRGRGGAEERAAK